MSRSKRTDPRSIRATRRLQRPNRARLRVITRQPRQGFHHPADERDILELLNAVGPMAIYGLRIIELARMPNGSVFKPVFGRYCVPGRILIYEQPLPPWRLPGVIETATASQLARAGAILTLLPEVGATVVDWPAGTLRRFMLQEVLLHEVGHHVLQHHKGKRPAKVARVKDHEAFAARFAERERTALRKKRGGE